ncbi:hypothetical protein RhiirA4_508073 [Rhizophagus irregularis]|uniref:Uncharacterized protein n=1 Tax=Rhizophagus irregularis TaxID=588596 RepID=A0A2I1HCZ2_9GLOM|nr:hypothetical protein RhiirA4_508073 [Rhizophagus irregularis]
MANRCDPHHIEVQISNHGVRLCMTIKLFKGSVFFNFFSPLKGHIIMAQDSSEVTNNQSNYDNIINDPVYEEIKLNEKLNEELKFSETLCDQLKNKYESLGKYYEDLQNNFNSINSILREKQEMKKKIGDLNDHNSKLIKLLVEALEEKNNIIQEKDKKIQVSDNIIQEKDNIIQQKDNIIQEKDNIIQEKEKDKEIQGKDKEIQEKDKEIQGKDNIIQEKDNIIQGKDKEIQEKDNIIQEKDKEIQEKDNIIQEKDKEIQEKDKEIQEKDKEIQETGKEIQEKVKEIQEKNKIIHNKDDEIHELERNCSELGVEAGIKTKFQLPDSVTLKDDIINLQNSLEEYITKCKGSIITEIDIREVQNLLEKYGSQTIVTIDQKPIIKAVLKRHVIEKIFEYASGYFNNPNARDIEVIMYRRCKDIVKLAKDFAEQRDGVDETTEALPIKVRQQICAALGNRGFNNVINKNNQNFLHDFIKRSQFFLNNEINIYRKLNPEKKKEIEDMAGDIIRKTVTLFWFRLNVQEPAADRYWFKNGDKINTNTMEGKWNDDDIDDIDDIVVDFCYFPLIANSSTRQIYTPAKIMHKSKLRYFNYSLFRLSSKLAEYDKLNFN